MSGPPRADILLGSPDVRDLHFYNAGCAEPRGRGRLVVPARRALRRVLRPIFGRLVEILASVCERLDAAEAADRALRADLDALKARHEDLNERMQETIAFGWDYVALVRRVAVLEDRLADREGGAAAAPAAVPFPAPRAEAS